MFLNPFTLAVPTKIRDCRLTQVRGKDVRALTREEERRSAVPASQVHDCLSADIPEVRESGVQRSEERVVSLNCVYRSVIALNPVRRILPPNAAWRS